MAHTRTWDSTTPADGDALSAGAGEIRNHRDDVDERMQLEHYWGSTGSTSIGGTHIPGRTAAAGNQDTSTDIEANGGTFLTALNGSVEVASDTQVLYVKVGTVKLTDGTWTAIEASGYSPSTQGAKASPANESVTMPNGHILKSGYVVMATTSQAVVFTAAFPNELFSIVITPKYTGTITNLHSLSGDTVAGFTIKAAVTLVTGYYWMATGR